MDRTILKFPDGFLWGSATSSYQVEGGIENNDWASFAKATEGQVGSKIPFAGKACDHYNRFEGDFDILQGLGQNTYRFSIEWARIEPEEGRWNLEAVDHYRSVLVSLRKRGIEPFITLWHFTLPLWFVQRGGWEDKSSVGYFRRYAEFLVSQYQHLATHWITMNEPLVYVGEAYLRKRWPPQKRSLVKARCVRKHLIQAHQEAFLTIKKISSALRVGIAKHFVRHLPARSHSFFDKRAVRVMESFDINFLEKIKRSQDFIGLNYYRPVRVRLALTRPKAFFIKEEDPEGDSTDMGWGIYPKGIYEVLKKLKNYDVPIYITENGIADRTDEKRARFIIDHLAFIHKAIGEKIPVKGYFYWSLLDNFEWTDGYGPKFGLVEVDFKTQERRIRKSAFVYANICKTNSLARI